MLRRRVDLDRVHRAAYEVELPDAIYKTCPWRPRDLVEEGLRQWLRCAGAALRDEQIIGMPSRAADEAWHGFILCTSRYAAFCREAYGRFLHHHPEGGAPANAAPDSGDQLARTVYAWSLVARPGEACVLWNLDQQVGVEAPWGIPAERVAALESGAR